jgi:hypothetical protein
MYYGLYEDLARSRQEQRLRRLNRHRGVSRGARQISLQVRVASSRSQVR